MHIPVVFIYKIDEHYSTSISMRFPGIKLSFQKATLQVLSAAAGKANSFACSGGNPLSATGTVLLLSLTILFDLLADTDCLVKATGMFCLITLMQNVHTGSRTDLQAVLPRTVVSVELCEADVY